MQMKKWLLAIYAILVSAFVSAQEKRKWDVTNPEGTYKNVSFTVDEGTWMNLDLSPDGKEIVFDLLGDIYSMPVSGGTAKLLRQGLAYEVQPRFSPDGKKILFTSDAGGGDNIWVMDRWQQCKTDDQRNLSFIEQRCMVAGRPVHCSPQTFYFRPLPWCRRNMDVSYQRW